MRAAVVGAQSLCSRLRESNSCACDHQFTARTALRHVFDDMPVAVAGGEILAGVHPRRVFTQCLFDDTERLDEILPVHCADEAQAADTVCDRDLVGGGRSACGLRQLRCSHPLFEQFLLDPGLNERHGGPLSLESVVKLLHKRRGQRHIGIGKLGEQLDQLLRLPFGRREHAVCPCNGRVALFAPTGDTQPNAAKVFQQRQLQHDRECPQFAQL
ncbi:hypothetical protein [Sulfuricella sp.]|uniref:hypothetical protein n=1 Tax=Sulfuricella sp. TaxID=2099377 RepID=UPI002BC439F5|nr:hypothetical protein [Sulfuricella sp.]HUX65176.1 hypothetical protein [Sulfuricella sp.]